MVFCYKVNLEKWQSCDTVVQDISLGTHSAPGFSRRPRHFQCWSLHLPFGFGLDSFACLRIDPVSFPICFATSRLHGSWSEAISLSSCVPLVHLSHWQPFNWESSPLWRWPLLTVSVYTIGLGQGLRAKQNIHETSSLQLNKTQQWDRRTHTLEPDKGWKWCFLNVARLSCWP